MGNMNKEIERKMNEFYALLCNLKRYTNHYI